ncbi:MAG TPA: helix-turn-helix transcriptional regulator [Candidatus Dormibacteraeota bacterium]
MATVSSQVEVGALLREWRERRRVTQLDLSLDTGISARHLSFVETGRSRPGRDTLLRIVKHLDVPFREQNRLLLATGHAPAFPERSLDDPDLAPVHEAFDLILARHDPYPAVVVDRQWNLVAVNSSLQTLTEGADIDPSLLEPPINVLRLGLHPRGLAPLMPNLSEWRAHFRDRLKQQVETIADENLQALLEEIDSYPDGENERDPDLARAQGSVLGPLKLRAPDGGELSFLGMFATFDTPFEVTSSELAIELLFPADRATGETLQSLARNRRESGDSRTGGSA